MKMVSVVGRRARMSLSLAGALATFALVLGTTDGASARAAESIPQRTGFASGGAQHEGVGVPDQGKPDATSAKAEIIILHGTNDGTGIDPKLGKIVELQQPPFSSYNSYKLLDRADVKLDKGAEQDRSLPDGSKLAVTLKDVVKGKEKDAETKYVVSVSIDRDGKSFLPSLEVNAKHDQWFFVAGQKYKGGILVIGIRLAA